MYMEGGCQHLKTATSFQNNGEIYIRTFQV